MNDTDITEPLEPADSNAVVPIEPTPPQELLPEAAPDGADTLAKKIAAEEAPEVAPIEEATLDAEAVGIQASSPAESEAKYESAIEAPVSVALPDRVDAESIFVESPIAEVPPGLEATDESPSESDPTEATPAPAVEVSAELSGGEPVERTEYEPAEVESPVTGVVPPPPAPSRPPVPPVFFVWHTQLNEERADTEVLPSERLREAYHLLEVTGALHWREVKTHTPDVNLGRPEALTTFHTKEYCQAMRAVSEGRASLWASDDDIYLPTLTHTLPTAGLNVAATRSAIKVAMSHPRVRVFTPAGQQPHACRDHLEEGHLFNDVLMALADAQAAGVKTAFINLDAEHSRQVQERFYNEPLLTISLHEHPSFLYPHTGTARETGKGAGAGYHVNIPMPPGVSDAGYQLVMEQMVLPLLNRFQPQLLVVLGGITAHASDPASHLRLTSKGYQAILTSLMDVVPRFVLFGGDATHYATAARLWAIALATMAERTNSLPPQIPAAHARLWSGGTFHDAEPLLRSAPYQEYTYALLANELEQAHTLLRRQWDLPDLVLPDQLSDQRERIQVRPSGDITSYTSKEPTRGMTFAGLSQSLGDDDDDEAAARRKPRPTSRSATQWTIPKEDEETPSERSKPRGRRDEPPPANPLGGSDRRTGFDSRQPREGGRTPRESERPAQESEPRHHGSGRGAPESKRGFPRADERRETRESAPSAQPPRGQGQRRQEPDQRRHDGGRGSAKAEERRDSKDGVNPRPPRGERQDPSRTPRTPHSAVLPRTPSTPDKGAEDHSPTPSRSTSRSGERDDAQHSNNQSFRRRERGDRGQSGQGEAKPPVTPPTDSTTETPDSRPARRHRPRSRR
jgi:acetoin utilization deacetylase AcuC-like enzyme